MYLRRKIDQFLSDWKVDGNRKPLIVKGPRQVGKTASIRHFASANYRSVIEINFAEEPKYRAITGIPSTKWGRACRCLTPRCASSPIRR